MRDSLLVKSGHGILLMGGKLTRCLIPACWELELEWLLAEKLREEVEEE